MRHPWLFVMLVGLLAGLIGDSLRWIASTGEWADSLVWMPRDAWVPAEWLHHLSAALLGVAGAWICYAVSGWVRCGVLIAAGSVLCFTGSAAVALHQVCFDPFPACGALLLGACAGWAIGRSRLSLSSQLPLIFSGRLSPDQLQKLRQHHPPPDLQCENRPVVILTIRTLNDQTVRKLIGPAAFLKLAEEFRHRATTGLLARGALLLPGSAHTIQACFGLPFEGKNDVRDGCQGALLLLGMMREFIGQRNPNGGGRLRFGIGLCHGLAASGLVNGEYQIVGDVVERSRNLADANEAWQTGILTDQQTVQLSGAGLLCRPIDTMQVGAEEEMMELYEICPPADVDELPAQRERLESFAEGVRQLREGNAAQALAEFQRCEPRDGTEDVTLKLFIEAASQSSHAVSESPEPDEVLPPAPQPAVPRTADVSEKQPDDQGRRSRSSSPREMLPQPSPVELPPRPFAAIVERAAQAASPPVEAEPGPEPPAEIVAPPVIVPLAPPPVALPAVRDEPVSAPQPAVPAFVARALNAQKPIGAKTPTLRETFSRTVAPRKSFGRNRAVGDMFEKPVAKGTAEPDAVKEQPDLFAAFAATSPAAPPLPRVDAPAEAPPAAPPPKAAGVIKAKQPADQTGKRRKKNRKKK